MSKHLKAEGKGEVNYDYREDTLFFKIKNREYKTSLDFGDIILDIDNEDFITGIQIFGASKLFGLDKISLRNVKEWGFKTKVENNIITVEFRFETVRRNKTIVESRQNIMRESHSEIQNSEALCKATA